jgi:DNA processing protein
VLTLLDPEYPAQLREVHEMPPILFCRGRLVPDDRGVSVVGSRTADADAMAFAREVAASLVAAGLSVLSGLARGVDTAAHASALSAGGRTLAFLGTGIHRSYPPRTAACRSASHGRAWSYRSSGPTCPPRSTRSCCGTP